MNFNVSERKHLLTKVGAGIFLVSFFLEWITIPLSEIFFDTFIGEMTSLFTLAISGIRFMHVFPETMIVSIVILSVLGLAIGLFFKYDNKILKTAFLILLPLFLLIAYIFTKAANDIAFGFVDPGIGFYFGVISFIVLIVSVFTNSSKVCSNCNSVIGVEDLFCNNCGNPVTSRNQIGTTQVNANQLDNVKPQSVSIQTNSQLSKADENNEIQIPHETHQHSPTHQDLSPHRTTQDLEVAATDFSTDKNSNIETCKACNSQVNPSDQFCIHCGNKLD